MRIKLAVFSLCVMAGWCVAGDTRLANAAMQGDGVTVRALLKVKGIAVNEAQGDGMTALHWAAFRADADTAEILVKAGADYKLTTRNGALTPMLMACNSGSTAIVKMLLEAGADANSSNASGTTALMMAASNGNTETVKLLLDHAANVNTKEKVHGETAIMFAAAEGRSPVVKLLSDHGADLKLTSLVVRLARGVDPDAAALAAQVAAQARAAEEAAKKAGKFTASIDPGRALGRETNVLGGYSKSTFATVMGGLSTLSFAARQGQLETVKVLVEAGADVNQVTEGDKSSPMVLALVNGHYDVCKYLLDHGADPNVANIDGLVPLYALVDMRFASVSWVPNPKTDRENVNSLDLLKQLLAKGAQPNARLQKMLWFRPNNHRTEWVDPAGGTAFWRAAYSKDLEAMKILVAGGADPNIPTFELTTPLMAAAGIGYEPGQTQVVPNNWMATVKYLVEELHADVTAEDAYHYTALHGAAWTGDNVLCKYLIDHGAKMDVKSKRGQLPTDMANGPLVTGCLPMTHLDTVAYLVKLGAPPPAIVGPNNQ